MKRSLILACLCLFSAHLASAQTGMLCLYSDPNGTNCSINDPGPGLISVYVIHSFASDVTGVRFSAPVPECMNAVYLGDQYAFPLIIGNTQTGVTVSYQSCLSSPINVVTMAIFGQGLSESDCPFSVLPHPDDGRIVVADCNDNELDGGGGTTFVNSDLPCVCTMDTNPLLYVSPLELDFGLEEETLAFSIKIGRASCRERV